MDKNILSISEATSLLGVSDETLRNWERDGKLTPFHTEGGHRLTYIGGTMERLVSFYSIKTGKRLTQSMKLQDLEFRVYNIWRTQSSKDSLLPALKDGFPLGESNDTTI